jgi:hypothetical protein
MIRMMVQSDIFKAPLLGSWQSPIGCDVGSYRRLGKEFDASAILYLAFVMRPG